MGSLPFSGLLVGLLLLDIVMLMPSLESLCLKSLTSPPPGMFVRCFTKLTATCQCARGWHLAVPNLHATVKSTQQPTVSENPSASAQQHPVLCLCWRTVTPSASANADRCGLYQNQSYLCQVRTSDYFSAAPSCTWIRSIHAAVLDNFAKRMAPEAAVHDECQSQARNAT